MYGINTIYHELFHVTALMTSALWTNIYWTHALGKAYRQDWPISQNGTAQFFGEKVYNELLMNGIVLSHFESIVGAIEARQRAAVINITQRFLSILF
jgi:hypothetical protein